MTKANPLGVSPFDAAEYLNDEETIAEFLSASVEMNDPAILLNALTTVVRARSMTELAAASGLGRESLYKVLKPGSQPRYETVMKVIGALGVEVVFQAARKARTAAEPAPLSAPVPTTIKRPPPKRRPRLAESRGVAKGEKRAPRGKALAPPGSRNK